MIRRTRLRKVSKKRAVQLKQYSADRKEYLQKHPFCQIYMRRFGLDEAEVMKNNGVYKEVTTGGQVHWIRVPWAQDIHHTRGRVGALLLLQEYWMSASRDMHEWAHNNPTEARRIGVLA